MFDRDKAALIHASLETFARATWGRLSDDEQQSVRDVLATCAEPHSEPCQLDEVDGWSSVDLDAQLVRSASRSFVAASTIVLCPWHIPASVRESLDSIVAVAEMFSDVSSLDETATQQWGSVERRFSDQSEGADG